MTFWNSCMLRLFLEKCENEKPLKQLKSGSQKW